MGKKGKGRSKGLEGKKRGRGWEGMEWKLKSRMGREGSVKMYSKRREEIKNGKG